MKMNSLNRPENEPVIPYQPGHPQRESLRRMLEEQSRQNLEIPLLIGNAEIRTQEKRQIRAPHDHQKVLGEFHLGGAKELSFAVDAALKAKPDWESRGPEDRMAIFRKAADLLATTWRDRLNASTMLGQSKTAYQAEIDSACELIDFFRFNPYFYSKLLMDQPISTQQIRNSMDYRPLEGFVVAISPFNFTSIAGNLPTAPALTGNTVIWKPAHTQMHSAYFIMRLLEEAGLPPGVINMVPCAGSTLSQTLFSRPEFAGLHFTGSTSTFNQIWKTVGENLSRYKNYPRLVGETGGKDFVFAHPSADCDVLRTALVRGAFEYQGQKCSAASRAYIPSSLWQRLKKSLTEEVESLKMGDPSDFSNFICAVIDEKEFDRIISYCEFARTQPAMQILAGGTGDKRKGYFIRPTVVDSEDPRSRLMCEEIFGPILTIHVYEDSSLHEALALCESTSPYGLTGAVIAEDKNFIDFASKILRHAAGNFYVNDKPTGAVVGQQPFGGARSSGTNDKAGSFLNIARWISPRAIKENLNPDKDYRYPFMK